MKERQLKHENWVKNLLWIAELQIELLESIKELKPEKQEILFKLGTKDKLEEALDEYTLAVNEFMKEEFINKKK